MNIGLVKHGTLSEKKRLYWEVQLFAIIRSFADGLTLFKFNVNFDRYESDPAKNEGKKELMAKALKIEAERDEAKKHTPWLTFAAMAFQLAIVLLSASILAVSKRMFWGSIGVSIFGTMLLTQGIWLVIPFVI
jgi:hypothetical protein